MSSMPYTQLQLREVFHIEFLRWLGRKVKTEHYAVKGGVNLRLFFKSFRYSEDIDLDAHGMEIHVLKEEVLKVLSSPAFGDNLRSLGIARVVPPDISKAKQTATTQRFKVHLILSSGEDLFTKIEFSRRGFSGTVIVGAVDGAILRAYKLPPILVPHYDIYTAVDHKISALAGRAVTQARDVFDLYVLSSQYPDPIADAANGISPAVISKAHDNALSIEFDQFRDSVVSYLSVDDQAVYNNAGVWEEVRLKVAGFIEGFR